MTLCHTSCRVYAVFGLGGRTRWPPHSNTIESLDSHNTLDRAGRVFLTKAIQIRFPSSRFGAWWTVARAGLYIFRWQSHTFFFPILRRLSTTQPPLEHFKASSGVSTCCWASHNAAAVISSSLLIQTQCVRVRMCVSLCVTSCSYFWYKIFQWSIKAVTGLWDFWRSFKVFIFGYRTLFHSYSVHSF